MNGKQQQQQRAKQGTGRQVSVDRNGRFLVQAPGFTLSNVNRTGTKRPKGDKKQKAPNVPRNQTQVGAVVRTRLTRTGIQDIKRLRISWVLGFTYVGNGTNGVANAVYLETASARYLVKGFAAGISGFAPIASSDQDLGQTYVADIEKHFARKIIRRMWVHVDSLQPSTSNNMMAVIGFSRGPGSGAAGMPGALASTPTANTVAAVSSLRGSFPVDSWEHQSVDISEFIAGGSGAQQNEFEINGNPGVNSIWPSANALTTLDLDGLIPASICVAGNSTTAGLEGTQVHQISIEQEIDLIDYIGAMSQTNPVD